MKNFKNIIIRLPSGYALKIFLFIISIIALIIALFMPIAHIKIANRDQIEELLGGEDKVFQLFQDINQNFTQYVTENSEDIESDAIDWARKNDLCKFWGSCKIAKLSEGRIIEGVAESLSPRLENFVGRHKSEIFAWALDLYETGVIRLGYDTPQSSNIIQFSKVLYDEREFFLLFVTLIFAILLPCSKIFFVGLELVFGLKKKIPEYIYTIISKLSMTEVFILAVMLLTYKSLPLMNIQVGYLAVSGYVVFTVGLIGIELIPTPSDKMRIYVFPSERLLVEGKRPHHLDSSSNRPS